MRTTRSAAGTISTTKCKAISNEAWVALHVPRFKKVRPKYVDYAQFLEAVLKDACAKLAPLAIVGARPKGIASFAEKIIRKRKLYTDPKDPQAPDPLVRMTDLCGGRVITQTAEQVHAICQFIEQAFDIDKLNSEDASQRLKPTEFGYRSVHYIVQVHPAKLKAAGIDLVAPPRRSQIGLPRLQTPGWPESRDSSAYVAGTRFGGYRARPDL
jgi:ppGpp synthetase/RelA/SpoT-type nucleotidyltranferase